MEAQQMELFDFSVVPGAVAFDPLKHPVKVVVCQICGEKIAKVNVAEVRLPLTGAQFMSVDEEHKFPRPFPDVATWAELRCPVCVRFRPFLEVDQILTTEGLITFPLQGVEDGKQEVEEETSQASSQAATPGEEGKKEVKPFTCKKCGKQFKAVMTHYNHEQRCKG